MPKCNLIRFINVWLFYVFMVNLIYLIDHYNCVYIYGLVLHNPIPDDLGLGKNHHTSQTILHYGGENVPTIANANNINPKNNNSNNNTDDGKNNNIDRIHNQKELELGIRCKQDSDCIDDDGPETEQMMYCDQHYGYCDYFRQIGELCRHDSQCDSGLICMFGRCEKPFQPGTKGARCQNSSECDEGLCCARQHGERICKPKLKHGQQCFVPLGGLDYSLNELCPCDEGLECRTVKLKNSKRKRKIENIMRCTFPTTNSTANAI